jgi:hypothetical protein
MIAKRAAFYGVDALDNDGVHSARGLHPELLELRVGDIIPASRAADDGFEVLALVPQRARVLGGLFDVDAHEQLPFTHARTVRYWHVTWAFDLERRGDKSTRLHVRVRAALPADERLHLAWIRPVHTLMQTAQFRHPAARAVGRLARDTLRDVAEGVGGAAVMAVACLSPFMRTARKHRGLAAAGAERERPGGNLVRMPRLGVDPRGRGRPASRARMALGRPGGCGPRRILQ